MKHIEDASVKDGQHISDVPRHCRHHHHAGEGVRLPDTAAGDRAHLPEARDLGGSLMITQSFLYNAIFFSYALVLTKFYHVNSNLVPLRSDRSCSAR
jgi:hypothetical protein